MLLKGKKIVLGITGSIAAYKAILLLRSLTKEGASVRVVMTKSAESFVSPLVLSTFSDQPVWMDFEEQHTWNNHVELGLWGDVLLIAPASCNTIAKMANGACDNILLATYLSARCPVYIAPAMDEDMYHHPATQANLEKLRSYGNAIIEVNEGPLASGLIGKGRMAEPEEIIQVLKEKVFRGDLLKGKKALVTAGPTQELIDPVRYISNFSSGKMGVCLAEELFWQGADVTLVAGPLQVPVSVQGIKVIPVQTAKEMEEVCLQEMGHADVIFMAAAVADYTPSIQAPEKIKKQEDGLVIALNRTTDILYEMGKIKRTDQVLIGFALETEHEEANAIAKLQRKQLDFIVLNSLNDQGAGFGVSTNKVLILSKENKKVDIPLLQKSEVAKRIIDVLWSK